MRVMSGTKRGSERIMRRVHIENFTDVIASQKMFLDILVRKSMFCWDIVSYLSESFLDLDYEFFGGEHSVLKVFLEPVTAYGHQKMLADFCYNLRINCKELG